ncbi:MAG: hypothetical protein HYV42_03925 [Candidatus Magasanikbacteria bacterium]|nr:hypothetical protein [Candidatus Magasanikbacteria bacterium]
MHTKLKGDIGELVVAVKLLQDGWHVAFPYGENLKYDLVVEKQGIMKRVQVKSVFPKNGVLHVNCRSSNNWSVIHYQPEDFEILATVDLESKEVYFIPSKQISKTLIDLRLIPTKNKQKSKINYAEDFKTMPL